MLPGKLAIVGFRWRFRHSTSLPIPLTFPFAAIRAAIAAVDGLFPRSKPACRNAVGRRVASSSQLEVVSGDGSLFFFFSASSFAFATATSIGTRLVLWLLAACSSSSTVALCDATSSRPLLPRCMA